MSRSSVVPESALASDRRLAHIGGIDELGAASEVEAELKRVGGVGIDLRRPHKVDK